MGVRIAHATSDERGKLTGGQPGDQTGGEVKIQNFYSRPWTVCLRAENEYIAADISRFMCEAAKNNHIGYSQGKRRTLYEQVKTVDYQPDRVSVDVDCDCSSLVACAVIAAGIDVNPDIYTGNMVNAILNTGYFVDVTKSVNLNTGAFMLPGDILVYPNHHTAVVVDIDTGYSKDRWYYTPDGWFRKASNEDSRIVIVNHHLYRLDKGKLFTGKDENGIYYLDVKYHEYEGAMCDRGGNMIEV